MSITYMFIFFICFFCLEYIIFLLRLGPLTILSDRQRRNLFSLNHHNAGVIVLSMIIVIYIARGKGAPLLAGDAARPMRSSGARHV